jgi:hypothetical protein
MRGLEMGLVRIGIPVDFENPDADGIVDFANGVEDDDPRLDAYGSFDLRGDRNFEVSSCAGSISISASCTCGRCMTLIPTSGLRT